jgi:type I restriction enzyme S subunit
MTDGLPAGWALTTLGEIAQFNPRHSKDLEDDLPVTFAPMPALDEKRWKLDAQQERPLGEIRNGYTHFAEGDVLFAKITPCMENGKAAVASNLRNGLGCGTTELHVLRPHPGVDPTYLYYFIHQKSFRRDAASNFTGTAGQLRVPVDFVRSTEIALPPTLEQRRIVNRLEAVLERIGHVHGRLTSIPTMLKRFRQAVLIAGCSGRLTADWRETHLQVEPASQLVKRLRKPISLNNERSRNVARDEEPDHEEVDLPETWLLCTVEDIAKVCLGGTPSRKEQSYWRGKIPWVSSGEVANCRIAKTNETITRLGLENSNAKLYPRGTVLIAMIGEGKTRGQAALLEIDATTNQNSAGLVFESDEINPEYVWYWALSEYERTRAVGRGGNQPALNGQKIRELQFPLPPKEEQDEIVKRLKSLLAHADAIHNKYAKTQVYVERISESILSKAFRGELVTTEAELANREGRSYETAAELLQRVARENQDGNATRHKRKGAHRG